MKKTLVLVTKPLKGAPGSLAAAVLGQADMVALIGEGVFNRPKTDEASDVYGMPGGHRGMQETREERVIWPDTWAALEEDVAARNIEVGCALIDYEGLVDAIERHEKIITL